MKKILFFILFIIPLIGLSQSAARKLLLSTTEAPVVVLPTVTGVQPYNVTQTTATSGGAVTNEGSSPVIARGVCWNTSPSPTISNNKTINGSGLGSFTSNISGLSGGNTYYVRAYATSVAGTSYSTNYSFITHLPTPEIVDYSIEIGGGLAISYTPVGVPDDVVSGDYIFVMVSAQAQRTWTTPSGWINIGGSSMAEFSHRTFLKEANGSETDLTISMDGNARTSSISLIIRGATSYELEGISTDTSQETSYGISGTALSGGSLAIRSVAISEQGSSAVITGTGWLSELNAQLTSGFGWMVASYAAPIPVTPATCNFTWNVSAYFGHIELIFE